MFKNVLGNVKSFVFLNSYDLVTSNSNEVFYNGNCLLRSEINLQELNSRKEILFINDIQGKNSFLIKKNGEFTTCSFQIQEITSEFIITSERSELKKENFCRDFYNFDKLFGFRTSSVRILLHQNVLFRYHRKDLEIETYFLPNENTFWSFSLSQLPPIPHKEFMDPDAPWEIKKFIGVLENKLWVAMNHRSIIALDIATGELVHNISEIPGFDNEMLHHSIPVPEATQLIEKESILLGMGSTSVWKINARTGEISINDYNIYFEENRIKNFREQFIIDDDLLFFLSDTDPKIGCFNWKTEQLVWQYAFEKTEKGEYPLLTEIQGNRHKLGVKDLANNVYIFEQE